MLKNLVVSKNFRIFASWKRNKVNNTLKQQRNMSGQKRLENVCHNNRVVAVPSKKRTDYVLDENGQQMYDKKTGEPLTKQTQLYNIVKMR